MGVNGFLLEWQERALLGFCCRGLVFGELELAAEFLHTAFSSSDEAVFPGVDRVRVACDVKCFDIVLHSLDHFGGLRFDRRVS